jgi:hypothetical protein
MGAASQNPADYSERQRDQLVELVERIVASQCFRASTRLCEFLLYVSDCAARNAPQDATEQQIGIHVFGRAAGYNSGEDSIVRTHARLVRQKLKEYFSDEGAHETAVLEIPKGHYFPVVHPRFGQVEPSLQLEAAEPLPKAPAELNLPPRRRGWLVWMTAVVAVLVTASGWWLHARATSGSSAIDRFWTPFLSDNSSLVIYSNALFTGDSTNGLKYAVTQDPKTALTSPALVDTYTGVGEVAGVYELTRLFDNHHTSFKLKRSLLVTWDEAKLQNLIFIGSVAENPSLRDVTSTSDFTMHTANGYSNIINHDPRPGEQAIYSEPIRSPDKDYAILAYLPAVQPGRHMLIFSGLMTIGTQAAVDFTCRPESVEQLLLRATNNMGEVRPFEAVLETSIRRGVPLQTRIVALHTR